MYNLSVAGFPCTEWWCGTIDKFISDGYTHMTVMIETPQEPDPLHISWGKDGLGWYSDKTLRRAWGEPKVVCLGSSPTLTLPRVPDCTVWTIVHHMMWGLAGQPRWGRPTGCATISRSIIEANGLSWEPALSRFDIA